MTPHVVLNDYPHRLTKNESKWISKIPIFKHFSELAKIWKCSLASSKFQFSTSFMNLEKTWIHSARPTFEDPNFESMDDRENLCPNVWSKGPEDIYF